ncbi:Xylose isomerase domain protein TIM barrel [Pirellula staleyi DSM 6068]|uniref:Xylose isomerase domain protein TIM barrel n=1 Tax=Pirellula staleyi (strain ATCC 27377 / DSM 6068 / ICPB 4128) TaxID=530564 RepID=D2R6D0_PIRSD|nr:sugar phosphate isomerase/epimerase [Pirellula staleyi]ADB15508.1 Xylose isomerase domain protein TIM barrel [Pirellula staleyi DSM 6068]
MFVAASTECFHDLSLSAALDRLTDLEYTNVELAMFEDGDQMKPSQIAADVDAALKICRNTRRLDIASFDVRIITDTKAEHYNQFEAICRLAKAAKVVTISVPSGELGTPFNEEVEHLRKLVDIATQHGVRVGMKSQIGRLSEDPDTVAVLCDNCKGLGLTYDPSQYIFGPAYGRNTDKLIKYVYHTHLRDTNRKALQVRVGQGEIEYGRIVTLLQKAKYNRALCVNITEMADVDHVGELRKMRLLLESLL